MAKQPKQTAREAKIQSLETFTTLLQEEPTKERHKKRFLSKDKMSSDPDISRVFNRYGGAVNGFNLSRFELMESKVELQRKMDIPLYESKKIVERRYWDCGLDDKGNFWYKNTPEKSFEERRRDFLRQIKAELAYDDDDIFFDKEPPATPADTSGGTPNGTSQHDTLEDTRGERQPGLAGHDRYKPHHNMNSENAKNWYERYALHGLPPNWEQRPAVELNDAGKQLAAQNNWRPSTPERT